MTRSPLTLLLLLDLPLLALATVKDALYVLLIVLFLKLTLIFEQDVAELGQKQVVLVIYLVEADKTLLILII